MLHSKNGKTFFLDHLGCAKNQVDSEIIIASLIEEGWELTEAGQASVIIINSCGFIGPAKKESIDHFFSARTHYPDAKIIFAGCMAERYGENLKTMLPEADGIFGAGSPERIVEFVKKFDEERKPVWLPAPQFTKRVRRTQRLSMTGSAYVKIAEGCNHFCRFCAIPFIKGRVRSKTIEDIIAEIKELIDDGVHEINLVAQDLAGFGSDNPAGGESLPQLLRAISALEGNFWVRLLYIHPDHFPFEILDIMEKDTRLLPYFDLPFQHAADPVLKKMGRQGSRENYLSLIAAIRTRFPDAVIRSTFLLGFPGETESDFQELLTFQQEANLDWAGAFAYSREEDTAAYKEAGNRKLAVPAGLAAKRLKIFEERQALITEAKLQRYIGSLQHVLIEESIEESNLYLARTYACAPEVDGLVIVESEDKLCAGDKARVFISGVSGVDLTAVVE
jgi:ribosomal protein S12 methylthiotransferase